MKFFDRVKLVFNEGSFDRLIREFMEGKDNYTVSGDIAVTENNGLKYSAFFACLRVLAETFASVPVKEYRKSP